MRQSLVEARLAKQLTQQELGKLVGKTKQSISDLERGRIEGRVSTWDALEAILGVPQRVLREKAACIIINSDAP